MSAPLLDGFGRAFHYLRLSVDDACNFRCVYCLPEGYHRADEVPPLTAAEIRRLVTAFAGLGFWKVRLTGGEPTTRRDILQIAADVAAVPGVRRVALSTNGYRLAELAKDLKKAGVQAVNVSVDSLDRGRFTQITGQDRLNEVVSGIQQSLLHGLQVKINVVLMKGFNDDELGRFLELTENQPIDVRFIELMQTGDNAELFKQRHISTASILRLLAAKCWVEEPRVEGAGPARLFHLEGHLGKVGVIAPYSTDFCSTCNRLRVTSRGGLRLCLFAEADLSLRHLLKSDSQLEELQQTIRDMLGRKEVSHYLPEGKVGNAKHFAMMGG